ncbi:MAG TPA: glycosyltransferase family 2 protein [Casimicrobiaceae bacterium]
MSASTSFPLDPPRASRAYRTCLQIAIVLGLAAIVYAALDGTVARLIGRALEARSLDPSLLRPSVIWVSLGVLMLIGRTALWFAYRPRLPVEFDAAPTMTVVIPAYNEGPTVERAIDSIAGARYPADRLQIVVVDDGSTDDTWEYIVRGSARHAGRVTTLRLAQNRGKREALAAGFRIARGAILVTVDSDSVIEHDALLAMAGPFRDPRIGAVAGKVAAWNRDRGVISRMLHVRFILSFDVQRSVQSTCRTVYCCPGALAAYRASVVKKVLEPWLAQRFLGARCTFGEDRALTNDIMACGFDTVYQSNAVVQTLVPTTYAGLCRMYLRWDRSHVREELRFLRIVWKRPLASMLFAALEKAMFGLGVPIGWIGLAVLAAAIAADPAIALKALLAIGVGAAFSMLYYLCSERSMRFVHGILYAYFAFFALWWIFPWAIVTVRSRSWLTR